MTDLFTLPRLYTDASGDSRFDTIEVPLVLHDHAPPAAPFLLAEPEVATRYILFRISTRLGRRPTHDTQLSVGDLPEGCATVHWKHRRDFHVAGGRSDA